MQLWLIPILPLAGFVLNGALGRRLSKWKINAIAVGSVLLSFLWVLKTLSGLGVFGGGNPLVNGPGAGTITVNSNSPIGIVNSFTTHGIRPVS